MWGWVRGWLSDSQATHMDNVVTQRCWRTRTVYLKVREHLRTAEYLKLG